MTTTIKISPEALQALKDIKNKNNGYQGMAYSDIILNLIQKFGIPENNEEVKKLQKELETVKSELAHKKLLNSELTQRLKEAMKQKEQILQKDPKIYQKQIEMKGLKEIKELELEAKKEAIKTKKEIAEITARGQATVALIKKTDTKIISDMVQRNIDDIFSITIPKPIKMLKGENEDDSQD